MPSFHSADCETEHSFIISKVRLRPKRIHCSKQKSQLHINTAKTALPELRERFAEAVE